jgi:hypothetical protein
VAQVSKIVQKAVKDFDTDCADHHDQFARTCERRYRSYRGVLERRSEAASWTNKLHPAYALQIVETMISALLDPRPRWKPSARPRMDAPVDADALQAGTRAMRTLLNYQLDAARFPQSRRPHRLQGLVCGLTVDKTFWNSIETPVKRQRERLQPVFGEYGYAGSIPVLEDTEEVEVVADDPGSETVDVRHFVWPRNAVSLERASRVTHRIFYSFDELKRLEDQGLFENVDELKESRDLATVHRNQDDSLYGTVPAEDDIEVLEQWRRERDGTVRVVCVGNRKVQLRDESSPYWHGRFPFVVCSGMPYPFQIPGTSEIELLEQLQEMLWTLQNSQLDNLQLLNNAIVLIADDTDDPEAFEFAPGEMWMVPRPVEETVKLWTPNPITAELAVGTIERLKADLQALSGGMPWLQGDNRQSGSDTATEASILTNLAQRRVAAKRGFFTTADAEVGDHFVKLNQQFLREKRYVQIVGADAAEGLDLIDPASFRDLDFKMDLEMMDESLMRQERRAEATARLQVAQNLAPVMLGLSQAPNSTTRALNMEAFVDDWNESYDVANKERYYAEQPPQTQLQPGQPGMNGQAQPGQEPGATAPQAVDMNSPANAFSQSPVAALQRLGAMAGGPANAG